jgi:hypothetical protein
MIAASKKCVATFALSSAPCVAGMAEDTVTASVGSFGSAAIEGATVLSRGPVQQSLAADFTRQQYSDPRAGFDRGHGM